MQEMPKLVIEVISPRQGSFSIIEKFQAYFALGIQSCWLVDPITAVVSVYYPKQPPHTFASGNVYCVQNEKRSFADQRIACVALTANCFHSASFFGQCDARWSKLGISF